MQNEDPSKPIVNLPAKELNIVPITLNELEIEIKKRVSMIDKEFTKGFEFIKSQKKSVTFFGSARLPETNKYYEQARSMSGKLSKLGYTILTGGGPGIMEAANRGAFEAEGVSLGLNIKLPHEQVRNPYVTDVADFNYFFIRKVMLSFASEAYVFFPGGFGTYDEFFELLTLVQTNKIQKVPIFLVGSDFWNSLKQLMLDQLLANNTIDADDLELFTITDDENLVIEEIKKVPIRSGVRVHHNG